MELWICWRPICNYNAVRYFWEITGWGGVYVNHYLVLNTPWEQDTSHCLSDGRHRDSDCILTAVWTPSLLCKRASICRAVKESYNLPTSALRKHSFSFIFNTSYISRVTSSVKLFLPTVPHLIPPSLWHWPFPSLFWKCTKYMLCPMYNVYFGSSRFALVWFKVLRIKIN